MGTNKRLKTNMWFQYARSLKVLPKEKIEREFKNALYGVYVINGHDRSGLFQMQIIEKLFKRFQKQKPITRSLL